MAANASTPPHAMTALRCCGVSHSTMIASTAWLTSVSGPALSTSRTNVGITPSSTPSGSSSSGSCCAQRRRVSDQRSAISPPSFVLPLCVNEARLAGLTRLGDLPATTLANPKIRQILRTKGCSRGHTASNKWSRPAASVRLRVSSSGGGGGGGGGAWKPGTVAPRRGGRSLGDTGSLTKKRVGRSGGGGGGGGGARSLECDDDDAPSLCACGTCAGSSSAAHTGVMARHAHPPTRCASSSLAVCAPSTPRTPTAVRQKTHRTRVRLTHTRLTVCDGGASPHSDF